MIHRLTAALLLATAAAAWAEAPPIPAPQGNVSDFAGVLDAASRKRLEEVVQALARDAEVKLAVATIRAAAPRSPKEWAVAAFEAWGIGEAGKDNGLLLLLAVEDRGVEIEVGYGLEARFTDSMAGYVLDQYAVPFFRQDRWEEGLVSTAEGLAGYLGAGVETRTLATEERRGKAHAFPTLEFREFWPGIPAWQLYLGEFVYRYTPLVWLLGLVLVPLGFSRMVIVPEAGEYEEPPTYVLEHGLCAAWPQSTVLLLIPALIAGAAAGAKESVPLAIVVVVVGNWLWMRGRPAEHRSPCCGSPRYKVLRTEERDGRRVRIFRCSSDHTAEHEVTDVAPGDGWRRPHWVAKPIAVTCALAMAATWLTLLLGLRNMMQINLVFFSLIPLAIGSGETSAGAYGQGDPYPRTSSGRSIFVSGSSSSGSSSTGGGYSSSSSAGSSSYGGGSSGGGGAGRSF
jgi:uncharacterized protein